MTPLSERPGRTIVVDGTEWKWKVGKSNIVAYSESGLRACCKRPSYREYSDSPISPAMIVDWLRDEMRWKPELR